MYEERAKSLRWLAFNFPHIDNPQDDSDKMCNCINLYCTQAADAIEELSKQIKNWEDALKTVLDYIPCWIPVTERCPEKSGDYLVFDDCRNLYVNEWHCLLKKWQYDDSRITHWMPLPEPPKEEADGTKL